MDQVNFEEISGKSVNFQAVIFQKVMNIFLRNLKYVIH